MATEAKSEDAKVVHVEVSQDQGVSNGVTDNGVAIEDVTKNGIARDDVKENGVATDVKRSGVATGDVKESGVVTDDAKRSGVATEDVKDQGVAIEDIKRSGVATDNVNDHGVATEDVKENGVATDDVKDHGVATEDVKENGVAKDDVKEKGVATEDGKVSDENREMKGESETKIEDVKVDESENKGESSSSNVNGEEDSLKGEETGAVSDLNENEKMALAMLRSKLEVAILNNKLFKEHTEVKEEAQKAKSNEEESKTSVEEKQKQTQEGEKDKEEVDIDKGKSNFEDEEHGENEESKKQDIQIDKDIKLWGVPLLPSKGDEGTDIILIKFLRARDFKADDAFEMLRNTLHWRTENKIDSILEEDFGTDYESVAYMSGVDREGHPVCYNVYGVFGNDEIYNKTFGTEESLQRFLRWRLQMMEKEIQKLNFKPGGVSSLLQINDLKDTPGPARKDLRTAMKQAVAILQDNYPEFVARNIFINVPFWYYAFNALLSPFLTQRTKSKFVFTRPARVTETLLKYIAAEKIPVHYGGLKRENDHDFSTEDVVSEVNVKAGASETIENPAPQVGSVVMWDLTVQGWEVNYKEEFVPTDESSYTIIVNKGKRIGGQEESVRNSFKNNEPGKVVITIENGSFKKKRVLYRFKTKSSTSSS